MRRKVRSASASRPKAASVFFFRHQIGRSDHRPEIPGRFAFDVSARALQRHNSAYQAEPLWRGTIYADAYEDGKPAPNVDPNVFSDVLPWHLSFCRISDRKASSIVEGNSVLSEVVVAGDVVVFGELISTHQIAVDSVMTVGRIVEIGQSGDELVLSRRFDDFRYQLLPELSSHDLSSFRGTNTFRLNLVDAEPNEGHHVSRVSPHRVIVGTRSVEFEDTSTDELLDAAMVGLGFNFVPLAAVQSSTRQDIRPRPNLFCRRYEGAGRILAEKVTKLSPQNGRRLLATIFRDADTLVLDPLEPASLLHRHDHAGQRLRGAR